MIKTFILLFNLIGLFFYHLFFQANVTVQQDLPVSANAGTDFVVEVTINKADVSGFAKYEEDFPKGFTATAIKKEGATILSSDNDIKFIWASLPSNSSIKISFRVTVDSTVTGAESLMGKFLYVVNNERQEVDAANATITVNGVNKGAVAITPAPADTTAKTTVAATSVDTIHKADIIAVTPQPQSQPFSASRSLSASTVAPAADILVKVIIHKGNISGFAKLEETIPNGVIAQEGDKQGASFTFVDNKAKFVWLNLPTDSVITISYKLTPSSTVSGDQSVFGEFSYLQNDNAVKFEIPSTTFSVQNNSQPVTSVPAQVTPSVAEIPAATTIPVTPAAKDTAAPVPPPVVQNNPPPRETTIPVTPQVSGAQVGVKYGVQIMALHKPVKASYLTNKYKLSEKINEEMLEGYTKYTVGHFDEYKSVRDHREEIRGKGVDSPFVVAYSGGKRITVQEALMISHQQWYK